MKTMRKNNELWYNTALPPPPSSSTKKHKYKRDRKKKLDENEEKRKIGNKGKNKKQTHSGETEETRRLTEG
jgi:hypothetical protein